MAILLLLGRKRPLLVVSSSLLFVFIPYPLFPFSSRPLFVLVPSSFSQAMQYPTDFPVTQPGVSSSSLNTEQRLQTEWPHFMQQYFVVAKHE